MFAGCADGTSDLPGMGERYKRCFTERRGAIRGNGKMQLMEEKIKNLKDGQSHIDKMIENHAESMRRLAKESVLSGKGLDIYDTIGDGPFDYEKYSKCQKKILFIAKEPNSPGDGGWDYKVISLNNDYHFGSMNTVAAFILNEKINSSDKKTLDRDEPIYKTAYINLNKFTGGGSVGNNGTIKELYIEWKDILEEQIRVYDPDIIICLNTGNTIWPSVQKILKFSDHQNKNYDEKYYDKNENRWVCDLNGKIVINTYHPGYIKRGGISYDEWVSFTQNAFLDGE
jgi:hypothetical protein